MPDTTAPAATAFAFPDALLQDLLAVSLAGVNIVRPLYDPTGALEDFALEYLNPAAQRMTGLPEQPGGTMRTHFPETFRNGVFAFYQRVFETQQSETYDVNYQADGLDNYFRLAARRSGEVLVVSFTDTADQPRTAVEQALRESQAAETTARAEAEHQRGELQRLFAQSPVAMALFQGADYVIELANEAMATIWGRPLNQVLGQPVFQVLPYVQGQGFEAIFADVLAQGTPYDLAEVPVTIDRAHLGHPTLGYFNLTYRPQRDALGRITGIITSAYEITEQVRARQQVDHSRQQVQALNEELAAINEELRATNDEYLTANTALGETQQQLRQLNAELEARVAQRTRQLAQAQAETEAQRQRLHQLITEAPALIATLRGPAHVVELANEGFRAIFGGRQLVGKPYREAIPEFESQPFFDRLDRVYRTGETYHGIDEPVILDRTNSGRLDHTYITYTYQATRDAQGQIDGILVFCYEVTEQVLARQEREAQRQQLQAVFAQAPVAVCVFRGDANVLDVVNPPMAEMLGHPLATLVGQPFFDVLPELQTQQLPALLTEVRRSGIPFVAQEQPIQLARHQPGEPGYFNFVYQPLLTDDGAVQGVVCVATDVTDQVQARQQVDALNQELAAINEEMQATNEELNDSNQQLIRVNVDLDNFIYTASHDLRAPISNLEGLLYLLREELPVNVVLADNVAPILDFMSGAVERFKRTIDHLTEVTKLQKEHARPSAAVDLAAVVENVRLDLLPLLAKTNAQLTVSVTDYPPILFSEKNLRSVVFNLLSNAVKYRHPDRRPHIDVQAHVQPGFTVLEVHDNGLGLDPRQLPRLFTMFQRFHDHVEGTGIGLYMVKRVVENAGGRIEVHSQLGAGTTFFVHLPHAPRPTP